MCKLLNLETLALSDRNGTYGGSTGKKEGVWIDDEYWILKYPERMKSFYTTLPLSEYIGSHIYEILGLDVQKTALGIRNGRIVVACKDFCKYTGELREIRVLRNIYHEKLQNDLELKADSDEKGSKYVVQLNELLMHFQYNSALSETEGLKERFWDSLLIDGLIKNENRRLSDWGLLFEKGQYKLAPVYGNATAFSNRLSDEQIEKLMADTSAFKRYILNISTPYGDGGQHYHLQDFLLRKDLKGLDRSIKKLVPIMMEKFSEIEELVDHIPEKYKNLTVCSSVRKKFYVEGMRMRMEELYIPADKKIQK